MITIVENGEEIDLDLDGSSQGDKLATLEATDFIYRCPECNCFHVCDPYTIGDVEAEIKKIS